MTGEDLRLLRKARNIWRWGRRITTALWILAACCMWFISPILAILYAVAIIWIYVLDLQAEAEIHRED